MRKRTKQTDGDGFDERIAGIIEDALGLRSQLGFGPVSISRDRAEVYLQWEHPVGFRILVTYDGRIENLGLGFRPPDPNLAFGLRHLARAFDPGLLPRFHDSAKVWDEAGVGQWAEGHAELLRRVGPRLLTHPGEVFERVRAAEPPGPQCERFVAMCREVLRLEADHGFAPPQVIHWGHQCEVCFERGPMRLTVRVEDHEKAGVIEEPFTVPEILLHHEDALHPLALADAMAELEPQHAARRPVADRYAMAVDAVRPWLEHDAAFLKRHPQLLS